MAGIRCGCGNPGDRAGDRRVLVAAVDYAHAVGQAIPVWCGIVRKTRRVLGQMNVGLEAHSRYNLPGV